MCDCEAGGERGGERERERDVMDHEIVNTSRKLCCVILIWVYQ